MYGLIDILVSNSLKRRERVNYCVKSNLPRPLKLLPSNYLERTLSAPDAKDLEMYLRSYQGNCSHQNNLSFFSEIQ